MKLNKNKNNKNKGFTLIEIMIVIVILGVLATLVLPNFLDKPDQARVTAAKSDISSISNALEIYRLDNYKYPSSLQELVTAKRLKSIPKDPWGKEYQYSASGSEYKLTSMGADGSSGGEGVNADISNN